VGVGGNGQIRVESFQRYTHGADYAREGLEVAVTSNRRSRQAARRTIIDMLETTPAEVARPHVPGPSEESIGDIDFDWRPQPLERVMDSGRSFRWPIIGAALVLAAIAIVAVRGLGTISDAQADERLTEYRGALDSFALALDDLEAALPAIDLEGALSFAEATAGLRDVASEPLPGLPPFVPQGALGEVADARSHLLTIADAASLVSSDLDVAATHQTASESLFAVPPLPSSAPAELLDAAAEAITLMQTETLATLAGLDADPRFDTYVERVEAALEDLPDWTDRYLLALRSGDENTTNTLIVEITAQRQLLQAELEIGLGVIAQSVEGKLDEIRAAMAEARILTATG
jgi:hypothetical protein